jgi:ribA/ribD-fused uncharacterized protein
MTQLINNFRGEYFFLSNFYPVAIWNAGIRYPSAEHAYQAAKTVVRTERITIAACETPAQAKRMGRKVTLRPDWDSVKLAVMKRIVARKFSIPSLAKRLVATFPAELWEGNGWGDRYWGVCAGVGANHLGKILMEVRRELMEAVPS